ncbi:MAG TPA: magnesium transporter, partial [Gammaproteobacteria bacterium]|nr:magnesium transporter [Gammaproteobacteria bacterium]
RIWSCVAPASEGGVLVELNEEVAVSLIRATEPEKLVAAATGLDMDDLADLMPELPETVRRDVLESLDVGDRAQLQAVMSYPEDSAGGLMNPDMITVISTVTVEQILQDLRMRRAIPADTDSVFITDSHGAFLGTLPLTNLLTSQPDATAGAVMNARLPALRADTPAHEVAMLFEHRDLISAAVVDEHNQLIGKITIDDVVDVIREEADHSVLSMAGLDEDDDMFAPVADSARRRSIWLGVNLAKAFLAAWAANLFEATQAQVVMLAILLPVVPSMGGVAGSQTLILITRGLALGQINRSNARSLLAKELGVAVYNAVGWALVVAGVTAWWFETWKVGLVIAGALAANLLCAAAAGFCIPVILRRLGVDPALAGGVVLTTITDVVGIIAFLGLGTALLL